MDKDAEQALAAFVADWASTPDGTKTVFLHLKDHLGKQPGVALDFISRPGLTYSLRAVHEHQKAKELFVMVDVIEDTPRWLSVCFYGEMITDPEEIGDFVPEGLLGEDAVCFDIDQQDDDLVGYVKARIDEAVAHAAKE
ncbi:hypothetical protein [Desulfatitalea alkaliphila]|uniref:Uncharacterized protein n=1 Tax=Desulfatitalea alkaliphila TaxID=2929485 RepID=A0AA41R4Z6_9BACT|nr:hypothetical protein [Desulfatitalea alkaliphila]MCJ8501861.1 hypothetical protein [Desulfatitalea alkaliphila]